MAKAADTSSTIVTIWLCEALALAAAALGSAALAKVRLREWLAAGKLPWRCISWKGLDAEGISRLERENRVGSVFFVNIPSDAYHEGDPQFWSTGLTIDWEDNGARENATAGAQALGIMVSREHLLALLPAPRQGALATAGEPAPPSDQRRKAGAKPKYDWDVIQIRCYQRFNDDGFPDNVSAFCRHEVLPWCQERYGEDGTPDLETLRSYVTKWIEAWQRWLLPE
jgi:hypothetical protein